LSASIGLVQAPASDVASVDELLARADELMYAEKKAGINARLAGMIGPEGSSALATRM
jgi:GGDEF domain-containing protein